jgi:hypothetical protein
MITPENRGQSRMTVEALASHTPGADCLQRPLVPRSRFRQQLRPSVRRQGSICGWSYDRIRGGSQRSARNKPIAGALLDACIAKGVALFLRRPRWWYMHPTQSHSLSLKGISL